MNLSHLTENDVALILDAYDVPTEKQQKIRAAMLLTSSLRSGVGVGDGTGGSDRWALIERALNEQGNENLRKSPLLDLTIDKSVKLNMTRMFRILIDGNRYFEIKRVHEKYTVAFFHASTESLTIVKDSVDAITVRDYLNTYYRAVIPKDIFFVLGYVDKDGHMHNICETLSITNKPVSIDKSLIYFLSLIDV
jgi:hypothetical protein